jgi:integrase
MAQGKLTVAQIAKLTEPGTRHGDGGNLWLQVSKWGTRSWVVRYWINGRERNYGLGPLELVSLADARKRALRIRQGLLDDIDPVEQRKAKREEGRKETLQSKTFAQARDEFVKAHSAGWKSKKTHGDFVRLQEQCKAIWNLPCSAIGTDEVLQVLNPIWTDKNVTAKRIRAKIESILAYAASRGWRPSENPSRWGGHLENMLAAPKRIASVEHLAAIPVDDIPAFAAKLRASEHTAARALEITMLCATRTAETIESVWSEIDLANKVWTIPAERMKAGKAHTIPLCDRALEIFKSIPRVVGTDRIFPAVKQEAKPGSMLALMRVLHPGVTVHGLRSSFSDWARDRTHFAPDVVETALAHKIKDASERAYRRGDALEKRRELMTAWASYCEPEGAKVIELRRRA